MDRNVEVTAADIARMADVGRAAVSNWRRRHEDFPEPVGGTATSPSFSLKEIKQWLLSHTEKGRRLPQREWFWQDLRGEVDEENLAGMLADLGAFLIYMDRESSDWAALSVKSDAVVAKALPARVHAACEGPLEDPPPPTSLVEGRISLLRRLADLAAADGVRETFDFLRERYFELHTKRTYATPEPVASLMAELSKSSAEFVLDPACGSGALLRAFHDQPGSSVNLLLGQDADEATARLTAIYLALHADNVAISCGDSLRGDAFAGTLVDAVVCYPPFNDRAWGYEDLAADPRWEYGLPPRMESELAWVQHALAHLKSGGTAVMLMPPAAANRKSGRRIRAQMIRRGALRAVITLPLGAVPNMAVALNVWVLRRPYDSRTPSHILMVDTSTWPEDFVRVAASAWGRFDRGDEVDEPTVSRAVPVIELLDDEVDLTPARYLSVSAEDLAPERVTGRRNRVKDLLHVAAGLLPDVESAPEDQSFPTVPLTEFVRRGMVTHHQQALAKSVEESGVPDGMTVLMPDDVIDDRPPTGLTPRIPVQQEIMTQPGDVVVPHMVNRPVARVVKEGGAVLGPRISLLRTDPDQLDPYFLAGFVVSSVNARNYVTMASRAQVDVRRADIPLLPIEKQRRYGEAFRRLADFGASLRQIADLGEDLIQLISDGLTHGSVRPVHEKGER